MSIIDDVRDGIRNEQERFGKTPADRIDRAAEEAKDRIVYNIKFSIKNRLEIHSTFPFGFKKYVIEEMPPVHVSKYWTVTPCFSAGGENTFDSYYVRTYAEKKQFLRAVRTKLEKEGISCSMKQSRFQREMVLHCKYVWRD